AFVLCDDGLIELVGEMRDLPRLDGDVEEVDARGLCAVPGLVDCHTHPAWGGDRVAEFALRAAGASYEELHAAGGGILSTVEATRALGEDGLRDRVARHREWMLRHGTATSCPRAARFRSRSSSARAPSTTSRRRPRPGSRSSQGPRRSGCCCRPARSSSTGRCRPPAPSWTPALRSRSPPTSTRGARSP